MFDSICTYDYVKCKLVGVTLENFSSIIKSDTYTKVDGYGEIIYALIEYKNLKFLLKKGYFRMEGSFHKFYNNGLHNHNTFYFSNFIEVLKDLEVNLNILPKNLVLKNLESGFNIRQLIKSKTILNGLLIHKKELYEKTKTKGKSRYYTVDHQFYEIKIYDKSLQYKLAHETLRVEVKHKKMSVLNNHGIITVEDLLDLNKHKFIANLTINGWAESLYFDSSIDKSNLTKLQQAKKYYQWSNPKYWMGLTRNARKEQKKQFNKVISEHSDNIQDQLTLIMTQQLEVKKALRFNGAYDSTKTLRFNYLLIELNRNYKQWQHGLVFNSNSKSAKTITSPLTP